MKRTIRALCALLTIAGCSGETYKTIGSLESLDPQFGKLVSPDAKIEIIAEGFSWIEGPLWLPTEDCLVFSNIPPNKLWKWTEKEGAVDYLEKSGFLGKVPRPGFKGAFDEAGSNGLLLSPENKLVLCQHGLRQIALMTTPLNDPKPEYKTLTDRNHEGKKYNSPNDGCYHKDGSLFFTDPPYGLPGGADDETRETDYSGVYRLSKDGKVTLIDDQLERPNGIALSPDQKTLYVANSHGTNAIWMAYDLNEDGTVKGKRVLKDVTKRVGTRKGMPDGLKINDEGYIFATAPGGVWVLDPEGKHLGTIVTKEFASNVAFSPDKKTLYITADMLLLRVKLR
ncbi:MAG: SMP-30/gluconolactonase/LRE family protein [Akkermansiaceae bacterium]|nr:SMP-30/gluconolactonase/LRE family protein [Akkermansiaceae bacterium]